MNSLRRKIASGNLVLKPWFVLKEIRRNRKKRVVPSWRDPTQLNLQLVKIKGLKDYLFLKK